MFIHFQLLFEFIQIFLLGLLLFPLFGVLSPWSDSIAVAVSSWVLLKENWRKKMSKTFFYLSLFTVICFFFKSMLEKFLFLFIKTSKYIMGFFPFSLSIYRLSTLFYWSQFARDPSFS